ncbi:MAG: SET domain-containing protein [Pontiellaceae bacterium]|nr:SET domain-containing protein [Pontiellaceae bacterium]
MIHPHTELRYIDDAIGFGVFAVHPIPRGTMVWVHDSLDREITPSEAEQLPAGLRERSDKYCYRNRHGHLILCWDHARYVNHSFTPNVITTPYRLELAVRDIDAGEQLTNDYGTLNIIEPFEAFDEGHHRVVVYPDDLEKYHMEWDALLTEAFPSISDVEQPLRFLISDKTWETCLRIADGTEPMRSILDCYYAARPERLQDFQAR